VQKYSQMLPSQITFAAEVSEYFVEQLRWVFFRYNRCPHHCLNGHEQFDIEIFFWWSRVSTIRRTPLCQRYDKESPSIHCQKVWSKTKHFAWYFPSVWIEGHSFLVVVLAVDACLDNSHPDFCLFLLELIVFQVYFVPLHPKHQEQSLLADSPTEF